MKFTVKNNGSDLHLSTGLVPMIRINGDIRHIKAPVLEKQVMLDMIHSLMTDQQKKEFTERLEHDFSVEIEGVARFRVNAFNQSRGPAVVCRVIPTKIKTLKDLGLNDVFYKLCNKKRGIVLVTGATGSGKSTTLAAMINEINMTKQEHILTIEDPIEFVHTSQRCLINQREVHRDTLSFENALRSALREDPNVILVGEMRDLETIRLALTAAETGHLVFGTLHTSSAVKTIDRIVNVFPTGEQDMIRTMLSESLEAVVSQMLIKTIAGGRALVQEVMVCTPAIRNLIRENKAAQMYSAMQTGAELGMVTLDASLKKLVETEVINAAAAAEHAKTAKDFENMDGGTAPYTE